MKDLQPNILDDYEHLVTNAMKRWGGEADFPVMEGVKREDLDDYLLNTNASWTVREVKKHSSPSME